MGGSFGGQGFSLAPRIALIPVKSLNCPLRPAPAAPLFLTCVKEFADPRKHASPVFNAPDLTERFQ